MSLTTVRSQVKTILKTISSLGEVHQYERYSKDWATYKEFFKEGAHINFVQILRPSFERTVEGSSGNPTVTDEHGLERVTHNFLLKGAYSLDDEHASEKICQDIVESICQEFRSRPTLDAMAEVVTYPIIGRIFNGMFGNVLCHIYEIEVSIRERIVF